MSSQMAATAEKCALFCHFNLVSPEDIYKLVCYTSVTTGCSSW